MSNNADKLKVFVCSRIHPNENWREAIRRRCEALNHEAILYPERSGGQRHGSAFMRGLERSDVVVYLIDERSASVDREIHSVLRDGKPAILLTHRSYKGNGIWKISDLASDHTSGPIMVRRFDTAEELENIVGDEVAGIIARRFSTPKQHIVWGADAYVKAGIMVRTVEQRFALLQETSSLILGPHAARDRAERDCLEEFYELIKRSRRKDRGVAVLHLFDAEQTWQALADISSYPEASVWTDHLMKACIQLGKKLRIAAIKPPLSPLMLADDSMMTPLFFGEGQKRVAFHEEIGEWAMVTWRDAEMAFRGGQSLERFLARRNRNRATRRKQPKTSPKSR